MRCFEGRKERANGPNDDMNGKETCKALKEIRRRIAEANDIEYVTEECKHKGECKGTCPKCEADVRMLERELSKKRSIGKKVALVGVAAGLMTTMSACSPDISDITDLVRRALRGKPPVAVEGEIEPPLAGDVAIDEDYWYNNPTEGVIDETMTDDVSPFDQLEGEIIPPEYLDDADGN